MDRLNSIIEQIKNDQCVLFIGAGLSKIAGCGTCYRGNILEGKKLFNTVLKETKRPIASTDMSILLKTRNL